MDINFIFTTNAHPNYAPLQLHDMEIDWRYPEMGYARNNEGYFLQDILPNFANMIERQTYTIISASESILRRLQRYIVEDSGLYFIRFYQEATIRVFWYDVARGILTDAEIDRYGQVHHMPHNFFDTISDDLDAFTDAALAIRIEELDENNHNQLDEDWNNYNDMIGDSLNGRDSTQNPYQ